VAKESGNYSDSSAALPLLGLIFAKEGKKFLGEFKMLGQNNAVSIRHTEERRAKLVAKLKDIFGRRLVGCKPRDCEVD